MFSTDRQNATHKNLQAHEREIMFEPDTGRIAHSRMSRFTAAFEASTGTRFIDYAALHAFSAMEFRQFWRVFVESAEGLEWSGSIEPVCIGDDCARAVFFPEVQLNYAQNVLNGAVASDDMPALACRHADGGRVAYTRGELRERVMGIAHALEQRGLRAGDHVAAIVRNDGDAITIALAVTALGATLCTAAPETSVQTLIERFAPLAPRMLIAHTMPRSFDTGRSVTSSAAAVVAALPSVTDVVYLDETPLPSTTAARQHELRELIADGEPARFEWRRFAFNHPLFVTSSPGATGRPEGIVHGAGGTLVEHVKEHRLHGDLGPGDTLFFQTNCASTLWHWQLSALASGVEIVTYDGPAADVDTFWRIAAQERVSVFGTNAPYLQMSEDARLEPGAQFDLSALRMIISAGAVTYVSQFRWVLEHVGPLPLQSVSGDADVMGSFVLGNPNLPVHAGEAQCGSLGLDVRAHGDGADAATKGELVCANPFPSRPLGFIGDEDGSRFRGAYFPASEGVWTTGDIIEFLPHGSARLHGRSGGVLRVRGIGVSPGDIYRILLGIDEIGQAVAVPRTIADPQAEGQGMVLLIVLRVGVQLDAILAARIRRELASQGSAALVPDVIAQVSELPVTLGGKLSEAAARDAVNGLPARNVASLRNPQCLGAISAHPALALARRALPAPGEAIEGIERYLCALWERHFSYAPIGRDDNFFELGGHSLLAARMLADIERATGRELPLDTLIVAPTIARLAGVIASEARREASSIALVTMRAGRGRPIFMAHSVTGSVMESLTLAHLLQCERPIFGLQAQGLEGEAEPLASVEAMAQSYVQRLRALQPEGPYALVGYSFGGLVVFEMAQQLVAAGEKIEMLCLIDAYVHERCLPLLAWTRYQAEVMEHRVRTWRQLDGRERMKYFSTKALAAADRVRMRMGKPARRPGQDTRGLPAALLGVRESARLATMMYKPRPYGGGPVILVIASITEGGRGNPVPAWRRVAKRGLRVIQVEGRHNDLLVEPLVATVAEAVGSGLDEA